MSASEEDIQASAAVSALRLKSMQADMAHHFRNRTVMKVSGDLTGLAEIATGPAPQQGKRGRFLSLITPEGHLDADLNVAPHEDSWLVDVHRELADHVETRLSSLPGVTGIDRSAAERWRIFGELPDQKGADTPFEAIRFSDTRRRELGNRVFRDAAEPEGFDWRHWRKWDGHAMRLGLLPDHRCVVGKEVTLQEAGYHRLLGIQDLAETDHLERRVLPVRIDARSEDIPVMANHSLQVEDGAIGTMLDQQGVCGIALITLEDWREALDTGQRITCLDEPVLITWPTWLALESEGHYGPAGGLI